MTPEERFERIEKTLDRIASTVAAEKDQAAMRELANDAVLRRIERSQEFLTESHKQLADDLRAFQVTFKANLESLHNFMSGAFERSDARLDRIEAALLRIAEHFDRHMSDGHGGD